MNKYCIPQPPSTARGRHIYTQSGEKVCFIWVFDDEGREIFENHYGTARDIMTVKGCSQATAYRLIASEPKRYWLTDMRNRDRPKCYSVLPWSLIRKAKINPLGNPGWHSGPYQQQNRQKALDKITK